MTNRILTKDKKVRQLNQSFVLIIIIAGLCIIATVVNPRFLRITNIINIFQQISVLGIIASGVGMLLISGDIDISVGQQVSLIGIILAMIIQKIGGIPANAPNAWLSGWAIPMAIVVSFAVGILLGIFNGLVVIKSKASSFIITLGSATVFKGLALLISGGSSYMLFNRFATLGRGRIFSIIPIAILFLLGVVIMSHILLKYFKFGRFLYALGGNKKAAFVSGINVNKVTLTSFIMVGVFDALAALILISRVGSALATTGDAFSLDALAAAVVGGVPIIGGKGNALNIFLGVVLIGLISNALVIMNINPYLRDVAIGLLIIIAVSISAISDQRK